MLSIIVELFANDLNFQKLNHPNIVQVGKVPFLIRYEQQQYTAFTVASVQSDLQQLIEVRDALDWLFVSTFFLTGAVDC